MMEPKLLISLVSVAPWHTHGNLPYAVGRLLDLGRANKPQGPCLACGSMMELMLHIWFGVSFTLAGRQQTNQTDNPILAFWKNHGTKAFRLLDLGM